MVHIIIFFYSFLVNTATPLTKPIEAYGDSLTAGLLSNTTLTQNTSLTIISNIMSKLAMFGLTHELNYISEYLRKDLSWPIELAKLVTQEKIEVSNYSFPQAKTEDLLKQISKSNEKETNSFFFIGHNDICPKHGMPNRIIDSYITNYERALKLWDSTHYNSDAYIISIINFSKIFKILKNFVWYKNEKIEYTCMDCWEKFFPYCPDYSLMERKDLLTDYITDILNKLEIHLETLVSNLNIESKSGNRFLIINPWPNNKILPEYFAVDCFHISHMGQKFVAKLIYEKINLD